MAVGIPLSSLSCHSKPFSALHLPRFTKTSPPPTLMQCSKPLIHSSALALLVVSTATIMGGGHAAEASSLQLHEPQNALSLPTWAIHVSSVVEWITAMILVWKYGDRPGYESWKGLTWGMVPLLGGAFCACTWHFFYNSDSLSVLVALQAALTVSGNFTMCLAAFHIYNSSAGGPENL